MSNVVKKIKTIALVALGLILIVGGYAASVQWWFWKWNTPQLSLPANHLDIADFKSPTRTDKHLAQAAQHKLLDVAKSLQSVSISGAISVEGELIWAGSVGLAAVEPQKEATVNTTYRIGSVSKSITAVILMRMVEEGLIELDTPIHHYLPDYPQSAQGITARHLVSHMAGIRHYSYDFSQFPPVDNFSNVTYLNTQSALVQFKGDSLLFQPGQGFLYSTHGYTLLSAVMEAAAGKRFEELAKEFIFEPVEMTSTQPEHLVVDTHKLAEFYTADNGLYGYTPVQNLSNKVAGGGFVSTPTDLVTFGSTLLNHSLLSLKSFNEMTTVQPMYDNSDNPQYYALGWRHHKTVNILDAEKGVDVIHHGGSSVGSNAFLMLLPEYNISVAILTNGKGKQSRNAIQRLAYQLGGMVITSKK